MSQLKEALVSLPSVAAKKHNLPHGLPSLSPPGHCGATGQLFTEVGEWMGGGREDRGHRAP